MDRLKLHILAIALFFSGVYAGIGDTLLANTYYVATTGKDTDPGTIEQPWGTWQEAFNTAQAGDTVYFRGGTWFIITSVKHQAGTHGHNGTYINPICFFNYPGEIPILDAVNFPVMESSTSAVDIYESTYLKFKGLTIQNCHQTTEAQWISGF